MKKLIATIALALLMCCSAFAQHKPSDFKPKFWSATTVALVAMDGTLKGIDAYATNRNLSTGGVEHDAPYRPFVQTTPGRIATFSALLGADLTVAYILHRRGHERLSHAILAVSAANNGYGAITSLK